MDGLLPHLRALVDSKLLTGYAVVTLQGVVGEVVGPLGQDLGSAEDTGAAEAPLTPAALQFLRPFNSAEPASDTLVVAGVKLLVVQQDEGRLVALGRKRDVCLLAEQLSTGIVLVVTWGRRVFPQAALCMVEQVLAEAGLGAPGRMRMAYRQAARVEGPLREGVATA